MFCLLKENDIQVASDKWRNVTWKSSKSFPEKAFPLRFRYWLINRDRTIKRPETRLIAITHAASPYCFIIAVIKLQNNNLPCSRPLSCHRCWMFVIIHVTLNYESFIRCSRRMNSAVSDSADEVMRARKGWRAPAITEAFRDRYRRVFNPFSNGIIKALWAPPSRSGEKEKFQK